MVKSIVATLVLVGSVSSFALDKKEMRAEYDAKIKSACSAEIATAGCGDKVLGKGLLKCIHGYKKDHKDFKVSDSCKNVKKELKEVRKEIKAEGKKENKQVKPAVESPVAPATK